MVPQRRRRIAPDTPPCRVAAPQAVASRSLERAEAWAKERDVPKAYGTYEELLADPDVDAV